MVQVALYTADVKLQHLLAPALGSGFKLVPQSDRDACQQLLFEGEIDVFLLDLESEPSTPSGNTRGQLKNAQLP